MPDVKKEESRLEDLVARVRSKSEVLSPTPTVKVEPASETLQGILNRHKRPASPDEAHKSSPTNDEIKLQESKSGDTSNHERKGSFVRFKVLFFLDDTQEITASDVISIERTQDIQNEMSSNEDITSSNDLLVPEMDEVDHFGSTESVQAEETDNSSKKYINQKDGADSKSDFDADSNESFMEESVEDFPAETSHSNSPKEIDQDEFVMDESVEDLPLESPRESLGSSVGQSQNPNESSMDKIDYPEEDDISDFEEESVGGSSNQDRDPHSPQDYPLNHSTEETQETMDQDEDDMDAQELEGSTDDENDAAEKESIQDIHKSRDSVENDEQDMEIFDDDHANVGAFEGMTDEEDNDSNDMKDISDLEIDQSDPSADPVEDTNQKMQDVELDPTREGNNSSNLTEEIDSLGNDQSQPPEELIEIEDHNILPEQELNEYSINIEKEDLDFFSSQQNLAGLVELTPYQISMAQESSTSDTEIRRSTKSAQDSHVSEDFEEQESKGSLKQMKTLGSGHEKVSESVEEPNRIDKAENLGKNPDNSDGVSLLVEPKNTYLSNNAPSSNDAVDSDNLSLGNQDTLDDFFGISYNTSATNAPDSHDINEEEDATPDSHDINEEENAAPDSHSINEEEDAAPDSHSINMTKDSAPDSHGINEEKDSPFLQRQHSEAKIEQETFTVEHLQCTDSVKVNDKNDNNTAISPLDSADSRTPENHNFEILPDDDSESGEDDVIEDDDSEDEKVLNDNEPLLDEAFVDDDIVDISSPKELLVRIKAAVNSYQRQMENAIPIHDNEVLDNIWNTFIRNVALNRLVNGLSTWDTFSAIVDLSSFYLYRGMLEQTLVHTSNAKNMLSTLYSSQLAKPRTSHLEHVSIMHVNSMYVYLSEKRYL